MKNVHIKNWKKLTLKEAFELSEIKWMLKSGLKVSRHNKEMLSELSDICAHNCGLCAYALQSKIECDNCALSTPKTGSCNSSKHPYKIWLYGLGVYSSRNEAYARKVLRFIRKRKKEVSK